ncbi:c-type cytochrome [Nannocystis pusilla]|uniref:C-type cytochrome n=1 Tax=Nannocystis pusilla TaxID=889268 RepID=A0ABS7U600_9BACT|nr:c-type cytochrome [Nannocystis pusilla]MBZ5715681.1 c-type cytochrome [Nannocystis pusilla]
MTRRRLKTGALLLALLALGGFLVVAAGLVPIAASSGHWRITAWFLHFAMRRAVATRTLGDELPPRDEPWLVLKGAGHYEGACRPCHGRPEEPLPPVPHAMTPHPPRLGPELATKWEPEELFYVVKHGIKFTGMPGWPSQQRDDEVLAMVAFLLELPDLDAEGYRRLVHGDAAPAFVADPLPELARRHCARCHGLDGCGRESPAFPRLAGQSREYLGAALHAFADGRRHSGIMRPIAAGLSGDQRDELAGYYSDQRGCPPSDERSAAAIARGGQIAERGVPAQRVPACVDCHGPGRPRRNAAMPDLAGQYADYLVLQLELFKARQRGGSAYAHLMTPVASPLDAEQIRDLAAYYASLKPAP